MGRAEADGKIGGLTAKLLRLLPLQALDQPRHVPGGLASVGQRIALVAQSPQILDRIAGAALPLVPAYLLSVR